MGECSARERSAAARAAQRAERAEREAAKLFEDKLARSACAACAAHYGDRIRMRRSRRALKRAHRAAVKRARRAAVALNRPPADPIPASELMNKQGVTLAAETRVGTAPNQQPATMEPPKSLPGPVGQNCDGSPKIEGGHRFKGATSIALRRLCSRLGTEDARFATVRNASALKQTKGESGPTLKATNPITGKKPRAFHVKSSTQRTRQQRHEQDGVGFDAEGNKGPVKKGDPIRDEKGQALQATYERNGRYDVYHASDLNLSLPENTRPMSGEWTQKAADQKIAAQCKAAGEPERAATEAERQGFVIEYQMEKRCAMVANDGVELKESNKPTYNFQVDKTGQAVIDVPKDLEKSGLSLEGQYSNLAVACAHASQHKRAVQTLNTEGVPEDRKAEAKELVEAYQQPPSKREGSVAYARAELVATYAAINEVTGHGAGYEPPTTTQSPQMREQWAQELEKPGGYARVSDEITRVEVDLSAREPRADQTPEQAREQQQERVAARAAREGDNRMADPYAEQTEHVRGVRQEQAARAAAPAPERPPAPGSQSAPSQSQTRDEPSR